jgi:Tfp pilus assembly protein PilO
MRARVVSLKDRLEKIPQSVRVWLPMIPIVLAAILVYFLILNPKARNIEQLQRDTKQVQAQVDTERRLLATFEPLSDQEAGRIKVTNRAIDKLVKELVSRDEIYNLVAEKAMECDVTGVAIDPQYAPTEQEEELTYADVEADMSLIKLTFYSDAESLSCLFEDIEESKAIMVDSLTVTREVPRPKVEAVFRVFAMAEK